MKLVLYLLGKFAKVFAGALILTVLALSLTDLLLNIWGYISKDVAFRVVLRIMGYYLPKAVWYAVPCAVLFATVYVLSDLYARNELLAVFASGVSLLRFTMPLLITGVLLSAALFFFEDKLVVGSYAKKMQLQNSVLQRERSQDNTNLVVMGEGGRILYHAEVYESAAKRLLNVQVLYRSPGYAFEALVAADSATWRFDHWELDNPVAYQKTADGYTMQDADYDLLFRLVESPEMFRSGEISVEEVSVEEARRYIARREKAGLPVSGAKADYYKKFAFPFVVLVVVILAIGLCGKTRKNVLLVSLALSIAAVVLFYVMQMMTMLMAQFGAIPPVFGEWFPVFFFICVSSVLLRFAHT
ncbi:MAG TPA: YjgP/YjgQ family permease [Treponema sp.]|nr:YjgP/YjgQ family permease [Treponema sp.]